MSLFVTCYVNLQKKISIQISQKIKPLTSYSVLSLCIKTDTETLLYIMSVIRKLTGISKFLKRSRKKFYNSVIYSSKYFYFFLFHSLISYCCMIAPLNFASALHSLSHTCFFTPQIFTKPSIARSYYSDNIYTYIIYIYDLGAPWPQ